MTRLLILAILPFLPTVATAQVITGPRPAGVIPPPMLPLLGSPLGQKAPAVRPAPYLWVNPFGFYSGYPPLWPSWEEPAAPPAQSIVNNYFLVPAAPPAPQSPVPAPTKARLILSVPRGAEVAVGGVAVDTAARPVVVDSPTLKPGQTYLFDVKVTWKEGDKTEMRTRQFRVEAGDEKSLSYFAGK